MGCNSKAHRELPGKVESRNLSRDNLSREIGLTQAFAPNSRIFAAFRNNIHRVVLKKTILLVTTNRSKKGGIFTKDQDGRNKQAQQGTKVKRMIRRDLSCGRSP